MTLSTQEARKYRDELESVYFFIVKDKAAFYKENESSSKKLDNPADKIRELRRTIEMLNNVIMAQLLIELTEENKKLYDSIANLRSKQAVFENIKKAAEITSTIADAILDILTAIP